MLDWLDAYDGPLFDACVTDPPYHLTSTVERFGKAGAAPAMVGATGAFARASRGFMGEEWDGGDIAFLPETWRRVFDALKPGAHLVAFSSTRTYHRMACAIEDAGFEIRDQLAWAYGSGFPKSHDVSKGIDRAAGAGRKGEYTFNVTANDTPDGRAITAPATPDAQKWQGWGSALKPAWEPICLARKPLSEKSIAANVLAHGTGAINVDGCRVEGGARPLRDARAKITHSQFGAMGGSKAIGETALGRFPANLLHDGSDEVLSRFPDSDGGGFPVHPQRSSRGGEFCQRFGDERRPERIERGDSGSAARFFYSAKAGPLDRLGTAHPTVKPVDLMRWLCRLITPPGGHILEPFAGSGKTGIAALVEGFDCTMIELKAEHAADIERQLAFLRGEGGVGVIERHHARINRTIHKPRDSGPLFGDAA